MTDAIKAELIGYRTYENKPYMRIFLEVPIEMERQVKECLGYTPTPGESKYVAVALLREDAEEIVPAFLTKKN